MSQAPATSLFSGTPLSAGVRRPTVPTSPRGTMYARVAGTYSAMSVTSWCAPALVRRRGRECPRTSGPAAHTERGDLHGFAPTPGRLLRRLSGGRARPGPQQLADGLHAPRAHALRVHGMRLHLQKGADRGATLRPEALPAGRWPVAANRRPTCRVSDMAFPVTWRVAS